MSQIVDLVSKEFTLIWLELQIVLLKHSNTMQGDVSIPLLFLKRWSHHPSKSNSKSASTHPDSSASIFGTWLGNYTAQKACVCIKGTLCFPWYKQCAALKPHPWQSAKTLLLSWCKRSTLYQLGPQLLPVSMGVGKNLSWFLHPIYKSWCRNIDLCPSCAPAQQHCTMGSGLGKSCLLPTFPSYEHGPHQP